MGRFLESRWCAANGGDGGRRAGGRPKGAITRPEGTIPRSGYPHAGLLRFDLGQAGNDFSALRNALRMAHMVNGASSFATVLDFGQRIAAGGVLSCVG